MGHGTGKSRSLSTCMPHTCMGDMYISYMHGRHICLIYAWETCMPHICRGDMYASHMHRRQVCHIYVGETCVPNICRGDTCASCIHLRHVCLIYVWQTCMSHACMEDIQGTRFFKKGLRNPAYKTYSKQKRKFLEKKEAYEPLRTANCGRRQGRQSL